MIFLFRQVPPADHKLLWLDLHFTIWQMRAAAVEWRGLGNINFGRSQTVLKQEIATDAVDVVLPTRQHSPLKGSGETGGTVRGHGRS